MSRSAISVYKAARPFTLTGQPHHRAPNTATIPPTNLPFVCIQCQARRYYSRLPWPVLRQKPTQPHRSFRRLERLFSSGLSRRDERPKPAHEETSPQPDTTSQQQTTATPTANQPPGAQRLEQLTTQLLASISALTHRLNIYTGTDYTPISALRDRIRAQEAAITTAHSTTATAKAAHATATAAQSASHKEVVQLLERKHSWTGPDLERYMALVRSEHANERAVTAAAADLAAAERALEAARAALERLERRMYHEEQVWSDTIRRNSTWVTFALMGVNLALLLGNVVLVEPWRRRRLVREFHAALDEKVAPPETLPDAPAAIAVPVGAADDVQGGSAALGASAMEAEALTLPVAEARASDAVPAPTASPLTLTYWAARAATLQHSAADLFSERAITLRKVDATTAALEGAAAGAAGMIAVLWVAGALALSR